MYSSVVLNFGGTDFTLNKINQDGYTGEFLYRDSTLSVRAFIRHTTRLDKTRGVKVERHAVDVTTTTFATVAGHPDKVKKAYLVFENDYLENTTDTVNQVKALTGWINGGSHIEELMSWAS